MFWRINISTTHKPIRYTPVPMVIFFLRLMTNMPVATETTTADDGSYGIKFFIVIERTVSPCSPAWGYLRWNDMHNFLHRGDTSYTISPVQENGVPYISSSIFLLVNLRQRAHCNATTVSRIPGRKTLSHAFRMRHLSFLMYISLLRIKRWSDNR